MAEFTLNVSGREQRVNVSPNTPLLWVLRDALGLTGTKFGCGGTTTGGAATTIGGGGG